MLSNEQIHECIGILAEWSPFRFTENQMIELFETDCGKIIANGYGSNVGMNHYGIMNKEIRKEFYHCVAKYLGFNDWIISPDMLSRAEELGIVVDREY